MSVRELSSPAFAVSKREGDPTHVLLRFEIPASRFGPVLIRLTPAAAQTLATELSRAAQP